MSERDEVLNITIPAPDELKTPVSREIVAHQLAHNMILIFGWVVPGILALDFATLGCLIVLYRDPEKIEAVVAKGIVPLLTATGTFASTVFGPLLAFILGYYFSQKDGEQRAAKKR